MLKNTIPFALMFGVLACAAPQKASTPPAADSDSLRQEVAQLKDQVARLQNQLGHLQSEVSAQSAEDELTTMTIDAVSWADASTTQVFGSQNSLACHVVEWKGYGKMLRFTRTADPKFVLEADGHDPIEGRMATGGICSSDGSARAVVLVLSKPLDPGARYRMSPRNEGERYKWSVPASLLVQAPGSAQ